MTIEKVGTVWLDSKRMSHNPLLFDIGANDGTVSVDLLNRFGGKSIAYEPGKIGEKIPSRADIEVHRQAVAYATGDITFFDMEQQHQSSSVFLRTPKRGSSVERVVEGVDLKMAFRNKDWVDFVSMDIEGAEWDIIFSNQIHELKKVDQICIEFHNEFSGDHLLQGAIQRLSEIAWFDCEVVEQKHPTRPIILGIKRATRLRAPSNKWLRNILSNRTFGRVLNLGCGTDKDQEGGYYSQYFKSNKVICMDLIDRPVVDVVGSSEEMPFESDTFDFVFANWMIYKTDVQRTLQEIVRVLRPGGKIMLSYGMPDSGMVRAITFTVSSLFDIESHFEYEYVAKKQLRRAEAVFGTMKPFAKQAFRMSFVPPILLVVAHWDDEVISAGGLLSCYGKGWTVVSVTHRDQETTYQQVFEGIGRDLGFDAVTLDIRQRERVIEAGEDRHHYTRNVKRVPLDREKVEAALRKKLGDVSRFNTVITHAPTGDYGTHPQHKEVSQAIKDIFKNKAQVLSFGLNTGTLCFPMDEETRAQKVGLVRRYKPGFKDCLVTEREYLTWLDY